MGKITNPGLFWMRPGPTSPVALFSAKYLICIDLLAICVRSSPAQSLGPATILSPGAVRLN